MEEGIGNEGMREEGENQGKREKERKGKGEGIKDGRKEGMSLCRNRKNGGKKSLLK